MAEFAFETYVRVPRVLAVIVSFLETSFTPLKSNTKRLLLSVFFLIK